MFNVELININKYMNKYEKWYNNITKRGQTRKLDPTKYTERHHIVPRSFGGTDELTNLSDLTAREHFICHWLLVKLSTGHKRHQMLNALRMMKADLTNNRYHTAITSRVYESIKEEYATLQSIKFAGEGNGMYGKTHTDEAKDKIRQANLGNQITEEQRQKIVESKLGKKREQFSNEWKQNLSNNHKSKKGYDCSLSNETKRKISEKLKGSKQSEEAKMRRKGTNLGIKREKLLCPHCEQLISVNTYPRWHGDNCKQKSK